MLTMSRRPEARRRASVKSIVVPSTSTWSRTSSPNVSSPSRLSIVVQSSAAAPVPAKRLSSTANVVTTTSKPSRPASSAPASEAEIAVQTRSSPVPPARTMATTSAPDSISKCTPSGSPMTRPGSPGAPSSVIPKVISSALSGLAVSSASSGSRSTATEDLL